MTAEMALVEPCARHWRRVTLRRKRERLLEQGASTSRPAAATWAPREYHRGDEAAAEPRRDFGGGSSKGLAGATGLSGPQSLLRSEAAATTTRASSPLGTASFAFPSHIQQGSPAAFLTPPPPMQQHKRPVGGDASECLSLPPLLSALRRSPPKQPRRDVGGGTLRGTRPSSSITLDATAASASTGATVALSGGTSLQPRLARAARAAPRRPDFLD